MGDIIKHSTDNRVYVLVNKPHTGIQKDGQTLDITIQASYTGSKAPTATAELVNLAHDGMTPPTSAVGMSLKCPWSFFEIVVHKYLKVNNPKVYIRMIRDKRDIPWDGETALIIYIYLKFCSKCIGEDENKHI